MTLGQLHGLRPEHAPLEIEQLHGHLGGGLVQLDRQDSARCYGIGVENERGGLARPLDSLAQEIALGKMEGVHPDFLPDQPPRYIVGRRVDAA